MMNEELEILKLVARRLEEANIFYILSGSMALNYYTIPRMTRDMDIVIILSGKDVQNFSRLFADDFYVDEEVIKEEISKGGMFNFIHKDYAIKIDFILHKRTDFQHSSFQRRKKVLIDNQPMWIISPEDLIVAKLLWAKDSQSEMQLNDVKNLLKNSRGLDDSYIKEWVKKLSLEPLIDKIQ